MAVKVPDVLLAYANNITFHKKTLDWKMTKTHFLFFFCPQSRQYLCLLISYFFGFIHYFIVVCLQLSAFSPDHSPPPHPNPPPSPASTFLGTQLSLI